MSNGHVRTWAISLLVACVAVRVAGAQPLTGAYARVADDPGAALAHGADGWTVSGTLGDASAQGLRELGLATWFWLADLIGAPESAGRTAWCVLVLVLAVLGAIRLGRARPGAVTGTARPDGHRESWSAWTGAALYACGPVLVTTVLRSPGDALVVALLPWVLTPIVRGGTGWRAAASSAVWLGLAGAGTPQWALAALLAGMVAAGTTARRVGGPRQFAQWLVMACAASAWWIAAYVWEVRHATDVTALVADNMTVGALGDALGLQSLPGVWLSVLVLAPAAVAVGALVLRVGDPPLIGAILMLSLVVVVTGAVSDGWPEWLAVPTSAATAYDTLPTPWVAVLAWVALAGLVAWAPVVDHVWSQVSGETLATWTRRTGLLGTGLAFLALVSVSGPLLAVQERVRTPVAADEAQWAEVARWSASAPPGRVLVLPPTTEGRTDRHLADALRDRAWISRDTMPLSGGAATAALDDVLARLGRGHDGPGTTTALRHLGVSYVLLRNDVSSSVDRERPVALVRHALARGGAARVAVIDATEATGTSPTVVDLGVRDPSGTVEIWAIDQATDGAVHSLPPLTAAGDSGLVADLADAGIDLDRSLVLPTSQRGAVDVVSDSARRRDVDQRVATDPFGPVVGAEEPWAAVPPGAARPPTAASGLDGARSVRASSSAAELDSSQRRTGATPAAGVDGNAFTAWQSRRGSVVGEWWEIILESPMDLSGGAIQVAQSAYTNHRVSRVWVEWDAGSTGVDVPADGTIGLSSVGRTTRLRVTATEVSGPASGATSFGIAELSAPGLQVEENLVVEGASTETWVLSARPGSFATCLPSYPIGGPDDPSASETVCNRTVAVDGPDVGSVSRVLRVDGSVEVSGRVWVRAADTGDSRELVKRLAFPSIEATSSSVASSDLVVAPQAAADGDTTTSWRPAPEDEAPTLDLSWRSPRVVSGLRVTVADRTLASRPSRVLVQFEDGADTVAAAIEDDGSVELPPTRARSLSLTFAADAPVTSYSSSTGAPTPAPIAVAEVEVVGGPQTRYNADEQVTLPCGSGPDVTIAGKDFETAVTLSARQVVQASVVPATLCGLAILRPGDMRVKIDASFAWVPLGMVLSPPDGPLGDVSEPGLQHVARAGVGSPLAGVIGPDPGVSRVDVAGAASLSLAVPSGTGWIATVEGRELSPVTVDGWAQGWVVPDGVERVSLSYASGGVLRLAVGVAALGWLAVLVMASGARGGTRRPV